MFTKKHYIAVAKILKDNKPVAPIYDMYTCYDSEYRLWDLWEYIAEDMADFFETDNHNFKREEFLTAVGLY